jgi:hypothetical protein
MLRAAGASAVVIVAILAGIVRADDGAALPRAGSYEVQARLELPNVGQYAATRTVEICLPHSAGRDGVPLPVLSANTPFAGCPARNIQRAGADLTYDIVCEGRGAATARARYTLAPDGFKGWIAMVMGGKNMTMREIQVGRRLGDCDGAGPPLH